MLRTLELETEGLCGLIRILVSRPQRDKDQ